MINKNLQAKYFFGRLMVGLQRAGVWRSRFRLLVGFDAYGSLNPINPKS